MTRALKEDLSIYDAQRTPITVKRPWTTKILQTRSVSLRRHRETSTEVLTAVTTELDSQRKPTDN